MPDESIFYTIPTHYYVTERALPHRRPYLCPAPDEHEAFAQYDDSEGTTEQPDVVDTAIQADGFNTLVSLVQQADLVETLKGEGPFTIFAPTDEAFAALPEETLNSLTQEENRDQLRAILTYHVAPGAVMAADVVGLDEAPTVQGAVIGIVVNDGTVTLNGQNSATVVQTDIEASNGVIHVIDTVLLPPEGDEEDGM